MPYGENTTGNLGSPSLISNLGNYCYQDKPKFRTEPPVANYNWKSHGNSSNSPIIVTETEQATTPPHLLIDLEIPETPESQLNSHYISRSPAVSKRSSATVTGSSQDSPILLFQKKKKNPPTLSDTLMDSPDIVYEGCTKTNIDEYEVFCDKERCLRNLLASCPMADIMEAQDILVGCKWDLAKAIEKTQALPPKVKKKSTSDVPSKGATYTDDISTSVPKSSANEVVLLSDDDDDEDGSLGLTVSNVNNSVITSNGVSSVSSMSTVTPRTTPSVSSTFGGDSTRKRRRIQCFDDDSDGSPLPSPVFNSNSGTPSKKANHNSGYSVLDFKPNTSNSDLRLPAKTFSYSKTTPMQNHSHHRSVDSSIFTNDFNDFADVIKRKPCRRNSPKLKNKHNHSSSKKHEKHRKKLDTADDEDADEDYGNDEVYNSEDDSDVEQNLTPARNKVLKFFQNAAVEELSTIPGCSKKKAEVLIKYRPFPNWADLVKKLDAEKTLSTELLNGAKKVLDMRLAVTRLMNKCKRIALQMEDLVEALKENKEDSKDYVSKQPELLNPEMHLTSYQMLGLNWLMLMHNQEVNGILADEMGLGKTVQAIAFLAYLKMQNTEGPHLIIVPSSTLDNWQNELSRWWPSASVLCYHGSQENRRELRMQIINDEVEDFDVMVATYNMVTSSTEDRAFFKKLEFHYVIFDEAHMLKNMASQRYQNLMRVKASRRLLLTGTPLQNNLVELMSLLIFAMPHMFSGKTEQIKLMFSAVCKNENKSHFEKERIEHAKRIMKPFVLRRLKSEVLKDLPTKHEEIRHCPMSDLQADLYVKTIQTLSEQMKKDKEKELPTSGISMMMQLRKAANHPLLMRSHYSDEKLMEMSQLMLKEPTHCDANPNFIFDDMSLMSDFELHKMCKLYQSVKSFSLTDDEVLNSGKFAYLNEMMPTLIQQGHRMLLFSQFVIVLDIIQEFMRIKGYRFLRLDGQVPVYDRQTLIDEFNQNPDIPVFLISTRAGGLGINLTSADTVVIHDIDFNPYNDKQAEDRCHRVGQTKDVTVIRLISKDTIEEGILKRAQEKLKLERDVTSIENEEESDSTSVVTLLRDALGLPTGKS